MTRPKLPPGRPKPSCKLTPERRLSERASGICPPKRMNKRLASAMKAYAVLIGLAFFMLHGKALYAVLILLGGLALKTLIAAKAGWRVPD